MMRNWNLRLIVPAFAFAACCLVFGTTGAARATVQCDPSIAGPGPWKCKGTGPNGVCQQGEQCDDGNTIEGDGCDSNCTKSGCGNGITVGPQEECDAGSPAIDGSKPGNDDKSGTATPPGSKCDTHCLLKNCGNHRIEGGELCDDGNSFNNDGCDTDPSAIPAVGICLGSGCGNGIVNMAEMMADPNGGCDDGNTVSGDGCSSTCKVEFCGDGVSNNAPNETCDDGNTVSGDGCNSTCQAEFCGDHITQAGLGEECDDANTVPTSNDGCSSTCKIERCGDGIKQTNEVCDDGNTLSNDNCRGDCQKDQSASCGDGTSDGNEQCDDGACTCDAPKKAANGRSCEDADGRTACSADGGTCRNASKANAVCGVSAGDGNSDLPGACRSNCDEFSCGDGISDPGEICDDGFIGSSPSPADDTDACPNGPMAIAMNAACKMTNVCGDGNPNIGHPADANYDPNACDNGEGTNPKTCAGAAAPCSTNADCGTAGPCGNSDTSANACHTRIAMQFSTSSMITRPFGNSGSDQSGSAITRMSGSSSFFDFLYCSLQGFIHGVKLQPQSSMFLASVAGLTRWALTMKSLWSPTMASRQRHSRLFSW